MPSDGPTPLERFINGILPENPVYRQLLGMCPTLAVTGNMKAAMTMSAAVTFVMICANVMTSLIRPLLKPHLRILIFTLTIATFVTIADRVLAAYAYQMSKELGPYIPLIIVNCIIICRCEVCASKQSPLTAASDAVGQSLGFAIALASIASLREMIGVKAWFGIKLLTVDFHWPWVLLVVIAWLAVFVAALWLRKATGMLRKVLWGLAACPLLIAAAVGVVIGLATGSWFGWDLSAGWWPGWGIMVLPPGAFITLGALLGIVNWIGAARGDKAKGCSI